MLNSYESWMRREFARKNLTYRGQPPLTLPNRLLFATVLLGCVLFWVVVLNVVLIVRS